jgi:hypothetical protein
MKNGVRTSFISTGRAVALPKRRANPLNTNGFRITLLGSTVLQIVWKGIESTGDSRWVSSQGAYWDSYREGHFQQCILSKGCTTNEWYPYIHEYLYANGGDVIRSLQ